MMAWDLFSPRRRRSFSMRIGRRTNVGMVRWSAGRRGRPGFRRGEDFGSLGMPDIVAIRLFFVNLIIF